MKVAITTGFLTKRNMDINAGHLAKIRYKNDLCTIERLIWHDQRR